jgi:hypothetical protein
MHGRSRLKLVLLNLLIAFSARAGDAPASLDDVSRGMARAVEKATLNAQVIESNGFHIESSRNRQLGENMQPTATEFEMLNIVAENTFKVGFEKGVSVAPGGGITIFQRTSGAPVLSVGDSNGDGQLDNLTYTKTGANGEPLVSVTDYEADGQPDLRVDFVNRIIDIWYRDGWHRVEQRGEARGLLLDGRFVELKRQNGRLIVP